MATLYEVEGLYQQIYNLFFEDESIDEEALKDTLESIKDDRDNVLSWLVKSLKNAQSDKEAYKAEKQFFDDKRKRAEKAEVWYKDKIKELLQLSGDTKADIGVFKISLRNTEAVEITDEAVIPDDFLKVKTEPMKAEIKKAIKAGQEIPGATIVINQNVQVK